MFDILEETGKNVLSTKISGKLTDSDYKEMFPLVEQSIQKDGKLNLYVELENFEGWSNLSSMLQEFKMVVQHYTDLKRVAIVGEKKWEEIAAKVANFVNPADIRYFSPDQKEEAKAWIQ